MPTDTEQLAKDILATIVKPSSESQAMLRMRKDMDQLAQGYLDMKKGRDVAAADILQLRKDLHLADSATQHAKLKAAEEALEFYASDESWESWEDERFYNDAEGHSRSDIITMPGPVFDDGGEKAKAALATIRAKEPIGEAEAEQIVRELEAAHPNDLPSLKGPQPLP